MRKITAGFLFAALFATTAFAQEATPDGRAGGGRRGPGPSNPIPPQQPASQTRPADSPRSETSTTTARLKPTDRPEFEYTAITGYMPLKDEQDHLRANIFHIDYLVGPKPTESAPAGPGAADRPVTFVFNGGPGAASVWLHMGAVGPRRIDIPADGTPPVAPYRVIDNEYSWLPATDLVFIDPVNTGYSRAANPDNAREFFGVQEDITAVGEFIRLWLTKNHRWGSHVFLAGESYGTTRASALGNYLQQRVGVSVSGITLISTVLNFATLSPSESNDLPYALFLPTYTAVAAYHKKITPTTSLEALLKDAEAFALGDYTLALAKGDSLPAPDRQKIARRLADLTGLPLEYVLQANLRINPSRFEKELLRAKDGPGKVIGRYDGRLTGWATDPTSANQDFDPSFNGYLTAYTTAFNEYAARQLKFNSDLPYEVLSGRVQPWNYASGGTTNSYLYVGDDLRDAMTQNPKLRVLVCSGQYDLATPYFATEYTLNHLNLSPELRKNITHTYFPGGHMIYHVREGLEKLYRVQTAFIESGNKQ